jgi:thermitase
MIAVRRLVIAGSLLCTALWPGAWARAEDVDPLRGDQWSLDLIGAPCAWQVHQGRSEVVVALIDSGVDLQHPDLLGRLLPGRDFVDGDDDPADANGHGTHVAGIIAAALNNAEGIAGLAPGAMILPVRVLNERNVGTESAIEAGIRYSVARGARVINMSLGATLTIAADRESARVLTAIRDAQAAGALVIVAAGNDFVPFPNAFAGEHPDAMVVAASDRLDVKARFSNSGPWIAVTAPGVDVLSTMPTYEVYLTSDALPQSDRFRGGYDAMSGTSQAVPHVAALAALLFSAHPGWSPAEVRAQIERSAHDVGLRNPGVAIGSGRIDACAALEGTETADTLAPPPEPREAHAWWLVAAQVVAWLLVLAGSIVVAGWLAVRRRRRSLDTAHDRRVVLSDHQRWMVQITVFDDVSQMVLQPGVTTIGRDPVCTLVLHGDTSVSRRHARITADATGITVEDTESSHGTYVNDRRIHAPYRLRRGDVLRLGQTQLRLDAADQRHASR